MPKVFYNKTIKVQHRQQGGATRADRERTESERRANGERTESGRRPANGPPVTVWGVRFLEHFLRFVSATARPPKRTVAAAAWIALPPHCSHSNIFFANPSKTNATAPSDHPFSTIPRRRRRSALIPRDPHMTVQVPAYTPPNIPKTAQP